MLVVLAGYFFDILFGIPGLYTVLGSVADPVFIRVLTDKISGHMLGC
jgi:hypothetical protein